MTLILFCISLPADKNTAMTTTAFRGMKPFAQLMFALFVMVASVIVFMMVGMLAAIPFYGLDNLMSSMTPEGLNSPDNLNFLKYFQVLQSIGLFVVPPFILGMLYHENLGDFLQINRSTRYQSYILAAVSLLIVIPFVNFLGDINGQMKLPESFSGLENWMKSMEDSAEIMVEKFMKVESISGLMFNIFMIAILPALGEELLFRGVIQRIFTGWTKNYHGGIWIAAFLFSAMHMQFYGFLPRMVLGAMFGYLLVWTGTMWVPILAHFVNNTIGVLSYYLIDKGVVSKEIEEWGTGSEQFPLALLSFVVAGLLLYLIYRGELNKTKMPMSQVDSQASRID
jgi:membrane protease YdiL (CAAX protease family)